MVQSDESVTFPSSLTINIINRVIILTLACFSVLAQNFKKGRRGEGVAFSRIHPKVQSLWSNIRFEQCKVESCINETHVLLL